MDSIVIKKLEKKYGSLVAVNKIDLVIKEHELFSLLGVNGAGKTTTIKMLSCLTKPTSGDAYLLNNSIVSDKEKVKEIINISPQETAVAPNLTVKENLNFILGIYNIKNNKKADEIIGLLKLEKYKNIKAKNLSGGYSRRLSIAMALITEPKILFLDEPTLGLDVIARRELWKIILDLKNRMTIVLTTHYMEEAEKLSDNIAIMKDGNILAIGTAKELIKKAKTKNFEEAFVKIVEEA